MWAAIAAIIAAVVTAATTIYASHEQSKAADYNAKVADVEAENARNKAAYEEQAHRENLKRILSSQQALYGKAGVDMSGTPLLVMEETAKQGELDALAIRYGGDVAAARARSEANLYKMKSSSAKSTGYMAAGSSLLTGASKAYSYGNYGIKD